MTNGALLFVVEPSDPLPLYAQLGRSIRSAIATGHLPPGAQLPTVRQLAVALRINANTVARVYAELEKAGVLETRRGVGTFVKSPQPEPASQRERDRDLRALADRFLSEAVAAGFTPEELMEHVASRTKKEKTR